MGYDLLELLKIQRVWLLTVVLIVENFSKMTNDVNNRGNVLGRQGILGRRG